MLAPGEIAPLRHLYVVNKGLVLYGGRVLSRGMTWGDDAIMHCAEYALPYLARSMTYTGVQIETLRNFMNMCP